MRETTDWLSKFLALAIAELLLLVITMACGIFMQTLAGYYHFEIAQYIKELFIVTYPQVLIFILFAFFIQTVVSNKFVGHGIVIGLFVSLPILFRYGYENTLYLPGQTPTYTYSDMNGYGHFVAALTWSIVYWFAIMAVLAIFSIALTRRGAEDSWSARAKVAAQRLPRLVPALAFFLVVAIASGSWYFFNSHVRNEFLNAKQRRAVQADYERNYKKYELLPQPKITAVDTKIDIFPERRSFEGTGVFILQNKTDKPIDQIHITNTLQSVESVSFDRAFHKVSSGPRDIYAIYALDKPLQPGETTGMSFKIGLESVGFKDNNERPELAHNGTFFDSGYFPTIGYDRNVELDDPRRRAEEKLPALEELAERGDPYWERVNLFTAQSDWITYHTIVSTSGDQTAIAPGYLKREWTENGRHFYEYDMGATHIADFVSYLSGRYQVKQEKYKNINLQIFYTPGHEYNLDDMLQATKSGLDYYDKSFGPYQFDQFRIIEFPRYRLFAQSFSNTVPYSEGMGFIARMKKQDDIDFTYFVTAHELGHQWWGHQLIGAQVRGSNMMSETLAEYSALKVMEKKYGADNIHKYLKHELDTYLRGRSGETRKEPPLVLVQREPYVWYQKGGLVIAAPLSTIGEDKVNAAQKFLNEIPTRTQPTHRQLPYPNTRRSSPLSANKRHPTCSTSSPTCSSPSSSTTTKPSPPPSQNSRPQFSKPNYRPPAKLTPARKWQRIPHAHQRLPRIGTLRRQRPRSRGAWKKGKAKSRSRKPRNHHRPKNPPAPASTPTTNHRPHRRRQHDPRHLKINTLNEPADRGLVHGPRFEMRCHPERLRRRIWRAFRPTEAIAGTTTYPTDPPLLRQRFSSSPTPPSPYLETAAKSPCAASVVVVRLF